MMTWIRKLLGGTSSASAPPLKRPANAPAAITEYQIWLISSITDKGFAYIAELGQESFPSSGYPVVDRGEQTVLRNLEKAELVERRGSRYILTQAGQWVYENQDSLQVRRSY